MSDAGVFWALYAKQMFVTAASLAIVFMGYRLFRVGVYGEAGNVRLQTENWTVTLRRMTPGGLLMLVGLAFFGFSLWWPPTYTSRYGDEFILRAEGPPEGWVPVSVPAEVLEGWGVPLELIHLWKEQADTAAVPQHGPEDSEP
jgi:hypothetical protein